MKRIRLLALMVLMFASFGASAADTIKLIVPTAPGGGTDGFFRYLAKEADHYLGATLVVVNVAGAGGTIGVTQMVRSTPNDPTLAGVWLSPITVSPHTMNVSYTLDDYIPVVQLTSAPYVLCVAPDFPASDGPSFIEQLKKSPDKYTFGTDGVGGPGQLATERVFRALGISQRDIPFKGAGETVLAFLGGQIDIYVGSIPPVLPYTKGKEAKAKCLLLTSAKRVSSLPSASGLGDIGVPEQETLLWRAVIAPKYTSPERVAELADAFEKAANSPEVRKFVESAGEEILIKKGDELKNSIRNEYEALGKVARSLNLQPPAK